MIGGWTVAAHLQPAGFDPVRQTISSLAARGAHDRFAMTSGLLLLGLCHVVTAAGLRAAAPTGRSVLAAGGVATACVASFPQPAVGSSTGHTASATIAFIALACWPVLAAGKKSAAILRRPVSIGASVVMIALLLWFFVDLSGADAGLSERLLAGTQSVWPLVVVLGTISAGTVGPGTRANRRRAPSQ